MKIKSKNSTRKAKPVAVASISAFAALNCSVVLTDPPEAKVDNRYWTVQVKNDVAAYTPRYFFRDSSKAYNCAVTLAKDRKIQLKRIAATFRPIIHPPTPAQAELPLA